MLSLRWCIIFLLSVGLGAAEIKNKGWWRNAVFYQVYPRSFMDANGDGIGDLPGILSRIEYFKESGITAIWLSPIYASPMVDFGYDISDFRDVDRVFGTLRDLEVLTKKAKEIGIKIIMDLVPNHTSDKHEWFIKSFHGQGKYKDYYVWKQSKEHNGIPPPNNWRSVFGGPAWTFNKTRGLWYLHQFEYRQPDLNYTNPDVRQEMEEIIRFWIGKGIDGFRVDAVPFIYENDEYPDEPLSNNPGVSTEQYGYLRHIYSMDDQRSYDLVKSWRKILDDWSDAHDEDEKVLLTEAYTNLINTTKYYDYGSHVPFNFNFIVNINASSKPSEYKKVIDDWMESMPKNASANWVMGNHDNSRTASRYPGRADQMTMLSMILPGIAVTYNGEEIAMENMYDITWEATQDPQGCNSDPQHYKELSRDPYRTPFQWNDSPNAGFSTNATTWLPIHPNYKEINLKNQKENEESHYNLYRSLTALRNNSITLRNGTLNVKTLNNNEVLSITRESQNESIVLLINFSNDKLESINIQPQKHNNVNGTVYVSSIGSGIKWNSSVPVSNILLQSKSSVMLVIKPRDDDRSKAILSVTPMKVMLLSILFILFKVI